MRKAIVLLVAAAGCAPAPAYRAPATVPAPAPVVAATPAGPAVPVADAALFGDAVLQRLIERSLAGNFDLRAAAARLRAARASRFASTLDFAPTVTGVAGYTRRRIASATFGGAFTIPDQDLFDVGAELSWELDLFGRLRQQWQAQGALREAAAEDVRGVAVALVADVAGTYFELRGAQARLAVAEENAGNQQQSARVVRERLDAGRGTALDTERAEAQLRGTLARIPPLQARVRQLQLQLDLLAGRAPGSPDAELVARAALPALPDSVAAGDLPTVVRRRPDVASAERAYAARRALTGAARREYLPRVSVNGSAGFTSLTFDSIGATGTGRFSIGPVISWPLLNLGRVKARADLASAVEAEAGARYAGAALNAQREIEAALVEYRARVARLGDLDRAAVASTAAAKLARLRFEAGIADFLQVLDAERVQLEAADQLEAARAEAALGLVAVYRALGGGWGS